MGLVIAGALPLPSLPGLTGGRGARTPPLLLGGAFALSWTPCVGPVLAAVLALASTRGGAAQAALLLGAYAAGLAVPLIASAIAFDRALGAASFLRDRYARHPRGLGHRARRARAARVLRPHVVAVGGRQPRAARRRPGCLRDLDAIGYARVDGGHPRPWRRAADLQPHRDAARPARAQRAACPPGARRRRARRLHLRRGARRAGGRGGRSAAREAARIRLARAAGRTAGGAPRGLRSRRRALGDRRAAARRSSTT